MFEPSDKTVVEVPRRQVKHLFGKKHSVVSEDDGDGNWLVSYADLMTLLFGFFVLLSSFSTPNAEKFEKLKEATSKKMGGVYKKPFEELSSSIKDVLKDLKLDKDVSIIQTDEGVAITSKGTVFFDSGSAQLKEQASVLMQSLSSVLIKNAKGFRIIVEGHTDDAPISSPYFPSNWELSASRAGTVVRLLESKGFSRSDLSPMGMADTKPLVPNRSPAGIALPDNQAENRRIVIRLQKGLSAPASR